MLSRNDFATREQARAVVGQWCYGFYNHHRRHSSAGRLSPVAYEQAYHQARLHTPTVDSDLNPEAA